MPRVCLPSRLAACTPSSRTKPRSKASLITKQTTQSNTTAFASTLPPCKKCKLSFGHRRSTELAPRSEWWRYEPKAVVTHLTSHSLLKPIKGCAMRLHIKLLYSHTPSHTTLSITQYNNVLVQQRRRRRRHPRLHARPVGNKRPRDSTSPTASLRRYGRRPASRRPRLTVSFSA